MLVVDRVAPPRGFSVVEGMERPSCAHLAWSATSRASWSSGRRRSQDVAQPLLPSPALDVNHGVLNNQIVISVHQSRSSHSC